MTHLRRGDADLHFPDGSHRTTSPSTSGTAIARYQDRIEAHLNEHRTTADTVASPSHGPYTTKTGKVLTDTDVDALAKEAERGYDPKKFRRRR